MILILIGFWVLITILIVRYLQIRGANNIYFAWRDGVNFHADKTKNELDLEHARRWHAVTKGKWITRDADLQDYCWFNPKK